jgi:formamidopyrimidine-DNA glycosylase
MPELPEVETMRRRVKRLKGATIRDFRQPRSRLQSIEIAPPPATFRRRVVGRRIDAVRRLGKRVVLELDNSELIVIEPRMTGSVMLTNPRDREHLRVVIEVDNPAGQLLFWDQRGLGVIRLLSPAEFEACYGPEKLGPDALKISAAELRQRLGASRRQVKVALLDQRAVAGIGNIYASEILHLAGIHPELPCNRLRPRQWSRLHVTMQEVLCDAIRHQGSTLGDRTYGPGGYQNFHRVYQKTGQTCSGCKGVEIVRIVQAQRSTFFCPKCQKR